MNLYCIEKAIMPQFSWLRHPKRKFQSYMKDDLYAGFGLMVFIGIANHYHLQQREILDYVCIEFPEYESKLLRFDKQWEVIRERKAQGKLLTFNDFTDRVYLKTRLTLNALNTQGVVTPSDFLL